MNGVSTREETGIALKESQINRLNATSIRMKMILRKRSPSLEKSPGWMPKSTTISQDGKKEEITLAQELGTVLQWNNQSNALKKAKTAIAMEALFSSLKPLLQLTRSIYRTLLPLSVKL